MKLAVTGKGGVGKTTISAGIARSFGKKGLNVIALDMDPSPNLLSSLGCEKDIKIHSIKPLMEMSDLIEERTGAPPEGYGRVFKINPKVDDILDKFGVRCKDEVNLLIMGTIKQGGEGCFCPANALAKRLIDHIIKGVDVLIMDMEAGVEHLGRGTTEAVEIILIVVEPSLKSIETAKRIKKLASDLGVEKIVTVLNKVKNAEEERVIGQQLEGIGLLPLFSIPYDESMIKADLTGTSIFDLKEGQHLLTKIDSLINIIENEGKKFG